MYLYIPIKITANNKIENNYQHFLRNTVCVYMCVPHCLPILPPFLPPTPPQISL